MCGLAITMLAGNAAYWPDLDAEKSTASLSGWFLTDLIHECVHAASCWIFDVTATPLDRQAGDFRGHRGLTHFAVTALGTGAALGLLASAVTARYPLETFALLCALVTGLTFWWCGQWICRELLKTRIRKTGRFVWSWIIAVSTAAFVVTRGALPDGVDWGLASLGLGVGVGLAVAAGMLAHDVGDCATKTGVPLFWPLKIKGRRYYPVHILPRAARLHTGKDGWAETKIRFGSWVLVLAAMSGWIPGLWSWALGWVHI
jgi:membrane-bound metal-dependent hydrolase YbcI (DUF457 family)